MLRSQHKTGTKPCRSPSPDLASHHIIKHTTIQIQDVKNKVRQVEQKEMKFELDSSYSQGISNFSNNPIEPKQKQFIQEMTRLKQENQRLSQQNIFLKNFNRELHQKSENQYKYNNKPLNFSLNSSSEPFHQRVHSNLERQSFKVLQSRQNTLRHQEIQHKLMSILGQMASGFEKSIGYKMEQLNCRLGKIQMLSQIAKEKQSRIISQNCRSFTPSIKSTPKAGESTGKEQKSYHPYREVAPFSPHFQSTLQTHFRQVESREESKQFDSTGDKKKLFQKMSQLQQQVKSYQNRLQSLISENNILDDKIKSQDYKHTVQKNSLINMVDHLKMILKEYSGELRQSKACSSCFRKQKQIQQLIDSVRQTELKFERQLQNRQQKEVQQALQTQHSILKDSEIMNRQFLQQLGNIKIMLEHAKSRLQFGQMRTMLQGNYELYSQLQNTFYSEREEYDKALHSYRQNLLLKEQEITRLTKEAKLKSKEIELIQSELTRIRELNKEYQLQSYDILRSNLKFMNRQKNNIQHKTFQDNHTLILNQLKEGTQKLFLLHQKVSSAIRNESQQA